MNDSRGYAAIPTWMIAESDLSGPALLVFAALASRAGFESIHPGQELLAREARCSVRRVRDAIRELEEADVIERVERRTRGGSRASDGYVLKSGKRPSRVADSQPAGRAASGNQPAENDTPTGRFRQNAEGIPLIEITTREISTNARERSVEELFEEWWKTYPRKVGKGTARTSYVSASRKLGAGFREILLEGVARYVETLKLAGTEARFIAHPSTWLNGERWADDHSAASAANMTAAARMAEQFKREQMGGNSGNELTA